MSEHTTLGLTKIKKKLHLLILGFIPTADKPAYHTIKNDFLSTCYHTIHINNVNNKYSTADITITKCVLFAIICRIYYDSQWCMVFI